MRAISMCTLLLAAACSGATGPELTALRDVGQLEGRWRMSAWEFVGQEHPGMRRDLVSEGVAATFRIHADGTFDATVTYQGQSDFASGSIVLVTRHRLRFGNLTAGPVYAYTYTGDRLVLVGEGAEELDLDGDGSPEDATERATLDRT